MRFRKSRCVYVSVLIIVLYCIILSILHHGTDLSNLLPIKIQEIRHEFAGLSHIFQPKDGYSFNVWIDRLFKKLLEQTNLKAVKMALFAALPANSRVRDWVKLPKYLKGQAENPHIVPFDPRLTLGVYLNELNTQLEKNGGDINSLEMSTFHWADWTDLSIIYQHQLSAGRIRYKCADVKTSADVGPGQKQTDFLDPDVYCLDDDQIARIANDANTDAVMKQKLNHILKSPNRLGFHVHRHPGRSTPEHMRLASASFLSEFMDPPKSILFLLPADPQKFVSLKVPVNQDISARVKLIDSPIASAVAEREISVLVGKEVQKSLEFLKAVEQPSFSATRELEVSSFYDKLKELRDELAAKPNLNPQEQNYLDSLRLSLATDKVPKYFSEAKLTKKVPNWGLGEHHDWRFFKGLVNKSDLQLPILHGLLLAWLRFTSANDLTTWVAHGSLLSWYWNGMVFPWDADIDVQMPVADLHKLSRHFNQTVVVDFGPSVELGVRYGRYFVDCGTWISHRQTENGLNFIDARFVDLDSGLYIDITGLAVSNTMAPARYEYLLPERLKRVDHFAEENKKLKKLKKPLILTPDEHEVERNTLLNLFNCRNNHFLKFDEISPLKLTYVEGTPAYVPNDFPGMLQAEYGKASMGNSRFRFYAFSPRLRVWVNIKMLRKYMRKNRRLSIDAYDMGSDSEEAQGHKDLFAVFTFSDQDYILLLDQESELLLEYVVSRDITALHEKEMERLLKKESTEPLLLKDGNLQHVFEPLRHDLTVHKFHKYDFDFDEQVKHIDEQYALFRQGKSVDPEQLIGLEVGKPQPEIVNVGGDAQPVKSQSPQQANDPGITRPDLPVIE